MPHDIRQRLHWLSGYLRYVGGSFAEDRCLQTAGALAYTSLLSLVPLTAMTFALLAAFPVFDTMADQLNDFVFSNFVPTAGEVVREHLQRFAEKASKLTSVGMLVLMLTALMLLRTIDRSFSQIFRVRRHRRGVSAFLTYWAVLTLGPILLGVSLGVTSYLVSLPLITDTAESLGVRRPLLALIPFLLTAVAFTLLYVAIPNRRVALRNGLIGGLTAALLFEAAKRGFAFYVTHFPTYELIYGALATIPIFLVWVYLSWLIILLGAEVTYCLGSFREGARFSPATLQREGFIHAFRLLGHLERAQRGGDALTLKALMGLEGCIHEEGVRTLLDQLVDARWVARDAEGAYTLCRDLDDMTLLDLHRALPWPLPERGAAALKVGGDHWNRALRHHLERGEEALTAALGTPLRVLLNGPDEH